MYPARQRRLVREVRSLARELPLYWGSSIAVRMDEDRPHLLKVRNTFGMRAVIVAARTVRKKHGRYLDRP